MMTHSWGTARAAALVLVAVALGALRIAGHKSPLFQAVAHLYVGFLFGGTYALHAIQGLWDRGLLALAAGLSVLELICFLVLR